MKCYQLFGDNVLYLAVCKLYFLNVLLPWKLMKWFQDLFLKSSQVMIYVFLKRRMKGSHVINGISYKNTGWLYLPFCDIFK